MTENAIRNRASLDPHVVAVCDALTDAYDELVRPNVGRAACILASLVAEEALCYFGVPATAVDCDVIVYSRKAWELQGADVPVEDWPDDAWSIGCVEGLVSPRPGWYDGGHVLVVTDRERLLLDLTAGQFSRPDHAMPVADAVAVTETARVLLSTTDGRETYGSTAAHGVVFLWTFTARRDFRHTREWKVNAPKFAGPVIRSMRERLEEAERG